MINKIKTNEYICVSKKDFNLVQTLECGQVFSYSKQKDCFVVQSSDKICFITESENEYLIKTTTTDYFINYFDLNTDYSSIKQRLLKKPVMKNAVDFGCGIRILRQDVFETIISFIVSANNNIKRITQILNKIRVDYGKKIGEFFTFPSLLELKGVKEDYFKGIGAGYRARYLEKVLVELENFDFEYSKRLSTQKLREELIKLSGVGPKVADCILLFGYGRQDVFPVDTWIIQMYNNWFGNSKNASEIRKHLTTEFKELSGYAQQYLFYYKRSLGKS